MLSSILKNLFLVALIDLVYLSFIQKFYANNVSVIQGGKPMQLRLVYAIPVYFALGYLLTQAKSWRQAFFLGLATYAVYDFTVLTVFQGYTLPLALVDTLWGGTLLATAFYVTQKIKFL